MDVKKLERSAKEMNAPLDRLIQYEGEKDLGRLSCMFVVTKRSHKKATTTLDKRKKIKYTNK